MFDGNCWDLVRDEEINFFSTVRSGTDVPYLSYENPPESIRDGSIDTDKIELDRPLGQSVDLDK